MKTEFYLPLLKSKAGEFTALYSLIPQCKEKIIPLFEVTPNEYDHANNSKPKTLAEHLTNFSKKIIKNWPTNNSFIDTNFLTNKDVDGMECIEFIYAHLAVKNIFPIPITHVSNNERLVESLNRMRIIYPIKEIGIRITISDVTSSSFAEKLNSLLDGLKISTDDCHIIFDLKDSDFSLKEDFTEAIIEVLKNFPHLSEWKSFTLAGGSFPSIGTVKEEIQLVPRNDWKFYNYFIEKLSHELFNRPINYGDYSIVAPGYFEFDPRKMKTSANIRYTHDEVWLVLKGKALKKSSDWAQYFAQAKKIVDSKFYLGQNFSSGDFHIKKCADKKTTSGNASTWMMVGNNHHFTKVINDLFAKSF